LETGGVQQIANGNLAERGRERQWAWSGRNNSMRFNFRFIPAPDVDWSGISGMIAKRQTDGNKSVPVDSPFIPARWRRFSVPVRRGASAALIEHVDGGGGECDLAQGCGNEEI
jgi:hypothetical protein